MGVIPVLIHQPRIDPIGLVESMNIFGLEPMAVHHPWLRRVDPVRIRGLRAHGHFAEVPRQDAQLRRAGPIPDVFAIRCGLGGVR